MFKIGIDVGGTFTDFVIARDGEEPRYFKTPSTPHDPSEAVATGLAEAASAYGMNARDLLHEAAMIIHGSTVATNTLVERKGARVGAAHDRGLQGRPGDAGRPQRGPVQPPPAADQPACAAIPPAWRA